MKILTQVCIGMAILFAVRATAEDLRIPALIGQTGSSATFGKNEVDAYTLALEEWNRRGGLNGKKLVLQVEDTQTSARQIISGFQRLALGNPPVVLGPTWLDGYPAVIPIARKKGILLVTPSAARESFSEADKDWPITFYHNSTLEIRKLVEGLRERGYKRIGLIYEEEPFSDMVRKLLLDNQVTLQSDFGVQGGETDFHSILPKLRAQQPDILVLFVWDEKSLLSLLQQLRVLLPELPLASVHDAAGWLKNPAFGAVIQHMIHTKFEIADAGFVSRFRERFGYEPILTGSNAYDAMNAVLSARAAGKETGTEIREYLLSHEFSTVTFGSLRFAADGSVPSKISVVEFRAPPR